MPSEALAPKDVIAARGRLDDMTEAYSIEVKAGGAEGHVEAYLPASLEALARLVEGWEERLSSEPCEHAVRRLGAIVQQLASRLADVIPGMVGAEECSTLVCASPKDSPFAYVARITPGAPEESEGKIPLVVFVPKTLAPLRCGRCRACGVS